MVIISTPLRVVQIMGTHLFSMFKVLLPSLPFYTTILSIPNPNQMTQYQRGKEAELALEVGVPKHDYFGKLGTTHFAANFKL